MKKNLIILFFLSFSSFNIFAQNRTTSKTTIEGEFFGFAIPKSDDVELVPQISHEVSKNPSADKLKLEEYKKGIIKDIYKIEIDLTENSPLEINIMDLSGKKIKSLYKTNGIKGENLFSFNKGALASGT